MAEIKEIIVNVKACSEWDELNTEFVVAKNSIVDAASRALWYLQQYVNYMDLKRFLAVTVIRLAKALADADTMSYRDHGIRMANNPCCGHPTVTASKLAGPQLDNSVVVEVGEGHFWRNHVLIINRYRVVAIVNAGSILPSYYGPTTANDFKCAKSFSASSNCSALLREASTYQENCINDRLLIFHSRGEKAEENIPIKNTKYKNEIEVVKQTLGPCNSITFLSLHVPLHYFSYFVCNVHNRLSFTFVTLLYMMVIRSCDAGSMIQASIVIGPTSVNTTLANDFVYFHCSAIGDSLSFLVNGTEDNFSEKGFDQGAFTKDENDFLNRTLSAQVSLSVHNTRVSCRARVLSPFSEATSNTTLLLVQGELDPVTDIVTKVINETTVYISWIAPPTLSGTIIKYLLSNIHSENGSLSTSHINAFFLVDSPDPCVPVQIQIIPTNGIDGRPANSSIFYSPSKPSTHKITIAAWRIFNPTAVQFTIYVDDLCVGEYPENVTIRQINETDMANEPDLQVPLNFSSSQASIPKIFLGINQKYIFIFVFANLLGTFEPIQNVTVDMKVDGYGGGNSSTGSPQSVEATLTTSTMTSSTMTSTMTSSTMTSTMTSSIMTLTMISIITTSTMTIPSSLPPSYMSSMEWYLIISTVFGALIFIFIFIVPAVFCCCIYQWKRKTAIAQHEAEKRLDKKSKQTSDESHDTVSNTSDKLLLPTHQETSAM